jgi:hypothetical protein
LDSIISLAVLEDPPSGWEQQAYGLANLFRFVAEPGLDSMVSLALLEDPPVGWEQQARALARWDWGAIHPRVLFPLASLPLARLPPQTPMPLLRAPVSNRSRIRSPAQGTRTKPDDTPSLRAVAQAIRPRAANLVKKMRPPSAMVARNMGRVAALEVAALEVAAEMARVERGTGTLAAGAAGMPRTKTRRMFRAPKGRGASQPRKKGPRRRRRRRSLFRNEKC